MDRPVLLSNCILLLTYEQLLKKEFKVIPDHRANYDVFEARTWNWTAMQQDPLYLAKHGPVIFKRYEKSIAFPDWIGSGLIAQLQGVQVAFFCVYTSYVYVY